MAEPVNGARGEASLKIDDVEIVIAVTMAGLAAVSTRLQCKSFSDLFMRLSAVEPAATMAAIECLTVRGDAAAALVKLNVRHLADCATAFETALSSHIGADSGNAKTAEETTTK